MLEVIEKNTTWKIVVSKDVYQKHKQKVEKFYNSIIESDDDWDVAFYRILVAFKNNCDKTITIYTRDYWDNRTSLSFQRLDWTHMFD